MFGSKLPQSLKLFVASVGIAALLLTPYLGTILTFTGLPLIEAGLIHACLIAIIADATVRKTIPYWLVFVPVLTYGTYGGLYIGETLDVMHKSAELRGINPGKRMDYDAQRFTLVSAHGTDSVPLCAVPVRYEEREGEPEGYVAKRLLPRSQCNLPRDTESHVQIQSVDSNGHWVPEVCELITPEKPAGTILRITTRKEDDDWNRSRQIHQTVTELWRGQTRIGAYRTASIERLLPIPILFIACMVDDSTVVEKCGAQLVRLPSTLNTTPAGADPDASPAAIMLGLHSCSRKDFESFHGFAENNAAVARAAQEASRVEDQTFEQLRAIIEHRSDAVTPGAPDAIILRPERLGPLAEGMAARLAEEEAKTSPNGEIERLMAWGLAALPKADFTRVAAPVLATIQTRRGITHLTTLYVRAIDIGAAGYSYYRSEFFQTGTEGTLGMLPVLAICRSGHADADIIAEMKRRYAATSNRFYTSALFVTLLKLGERDFLSRQSSDWRDSLFGLDKWKRAVLDGKGATATGPNNCMGQEWGTGDTRSAAMKATLDTDGRVL